MDIPKAKNTKKNVFLKTWEKCRSMSSTSRADKYQQPNEALTKSKSCAQSGSQVAPGGCFSVYVGPEKKRFVIKAKYANHPLFMMLLEDSEMEYGYSSQGPILLPCEVDLLYKVLAEIDNQVHDNHLKSRDKIMNHSGYGYAASCSPFNPSRRRIRHEGDMASGGYGSYGLLSSPMLKLN
ncbi:auxin-responsive protein SAUR71-like [Impatiens glandulifera]|uniref:auxin-responsive protein SAUR71-like n=1 Tax=Impatiens glandulifera TaxID=253017 RepID=UPI001FB17BBC|nr:auxin-responsive protein SAUR71-like [Impatiens glandulifera]